MRKHIYFIFFSLIFLSPQLGLAQNTYLYGKVKDAVTGEKLVGVKVYLDKGKTTVVTNEKGEYRFNEITPGKYEIGAFLLGYKAASKEVEIHKGYNHLDFKLEVPEDLLDEIEITTGQSLSGISRLNAVEGAAIYASKKNEVILPTNLTVNLANNNSRQVYASVPGLNIWESDGAGIQLGIGARGLSPDRTSNFNVRQNGYDISADALGYPESYYTPSTEAIERIELVRGAASLQYGTQFGGLLNFKLKEGPKDKPVEFTARQTVGSFGFFNSFNSLGGTVGKVNYYTFYQHKQGNGWRPNSQFDLDMFYTHLKWEVSKKLDFTFQYTFMDYLAQQPGGLTDAMFKEDPRQSIRERNWFQVDWNLASFIVDYQINDKLKINIRNFGLIGGRDALGNLGRIDRVDDNGNRDLFVDDFRNFGNETRLVYHYDFLKNPATLLVGGRYYNGFTYRRQGLGPDGKEADFTFLNPDNLEGSDYDFPGENISLFAENIFNISEKLTITPGIRFESIKTKADGYYQDKTLVPDPITGIATDSTYKVYENKVNKRSFVFLGLGASYWINENFEIYGNFSQNYRAINFNDIRVVNPNQSVDENITDESGYNFDFGIRGKNDDWFNYDVSLFYLRYNGRIGSILRVDEQNYRIYRFRTNVADSRHIGLESFAQIDVLKAASIASNFGLKVFGNFSFINARYMNSEVAGINGNKVELVPEFNAKTGINFNWKKLKGSYQFSYTSGQYSDATNAEFTPSAVEGFIPSYHVMDLSLSYPYKWFTFEGGINNLSNNMYFTRRASGYPGPGIIPSDGRSFYFTLQVKI